MCNTLNIACLHGEYANSIRNTSKGWFLLIIQKNISYHVKYDQCNENTLNSLVSQCKIQYMLNTLNTACFHSVIHCKCITACLHDESAYSIRNTSKALFSQIIQKNISYHVKYDQCNENTLNSLVSWCKIQYMLNTLNTACFHGIKHFTCATHWTQLVYILYMLIVQKTNRITQFHSVKHSTSSTH